MIKIRFVLVLLAVVLLGISCSEKNTISIRISGNIDALTENKIALKKLTDLRQGKAKTLKNISVDSDGKFDATFPYEPNIYQLEIADKVYPFVLSENKEVIVSGSQNELKFNGPEGIQLIMDYEQFRLASLDRVVGPVRAQIRRSRKNGASPTEIAALQALEVKDYQSHLEELMEFSKEHLGGSLALYWSSLRWDGGAYIDFLNSAIDSLAIKYPDSELIDLLWRQLEVLEQNSEGSLFADIALPDISNNIIRLNQVRKKYTLVDFWASWCGPCRAEGPLLNQLYAKYNALGFEIYGVSMDDKKNRWRDALEKDNRIWHNVSSLKGMHSNEALQFGINALPSNFLIDNNGKIIVTDVHGADLSEILENLFSD